MNKSVKYYINEAGIICDNTVEPIGCKFVYKNFKRHVEIWIVSRRTGEVLGEYVLFNSTEELMATGVCV